ncbi:MAG: T9SS type A sorting domain-containing protein, partial [Gemmatimonadales bacterium]|nr:T9SS type A sorting domain-containing protein [Gemmatimonadales bacterium]
APYFDNVSLICYEHFGPSLVARELDLAQDAFPEDGDLYSGTQMNLNNVRFDMANNISLATDLRNDPGDSIVVDIVPVRTGSVLVESDVDAVVKAPRLHWTLEEGVSVDISWRFNLTGAEGAGYTGLDDNGNLCGEVPGAHAMANGVPHPVKWMFDLPDNGFLFPGDVLHYYIEAWDDVLGNHQNATLPADLTSFGDFSDPRAYNTRFVVRALPALFDDSGDQPTLLFWNDFASHDGQNMWYNAFANLGFNPGWVYDSYYTNAPSSGVGNGLGGRASGGQLYGYDIMVYTCGDLATSTITNQDYDRDAGDDVGVVTDWMAQGGKHLFTTGDGLVYDLNRSGTSTQAFVTDYMGLSYVSNDVRPLLGGDTAPVVTPVAGNSVFQTTDSWIAFGGCSRINTFDAVTVNEGEPLAVFNDGITGYSAATKYVAANGSKVISLPYDFMFIRTPPTTPAKAKQLSPLPARVRLLKEVLTDFNLPPGIYMPTSVDLPSKVFAATAYPNPFNPLTKIKFTMPKAGHLSLKIFNVRGELVRTLINEATAEGPGAVMWDGSSDQGHLMSSGVYFYEARTAGGVKVNKMTLVR